MKLRILISGLVMLAIIQGKSQSMIDLTKDEVKLVIKKEHRNLTADKSVVKQAFNYLKFVNRSQTVTLIVYFSENDIATSSKMVCDYAEYDFILDELNEKYKKVGKNNWEFENGDFTCKVEMKEQEWYFTVREKKKEQKKSLFKKK
jgi:hypothetical protein